MAELIDKLATGDMIELQIFILFGGFILAMVFLYFNARRLISKKKNGDMTVTPRPPKSWKNFCRTGSKR